MLFSLCVLSCTPCVFIVCEIESKHKGLEVYTSRKVPATGTVVSGCECLGLWCLLTTYWDVAWIPGCQQRSKHVFVYCFRRDFLCLTILLRETILLFIFQRSTRTRGCVWTGAFSNCQQAAHWDGDVSENYKSKMEMSLMAVTRRFIYTSPFTGSTLITEIYDQHH